VEPAGTPVSRVRVVGEVQRYFYKKVFKTIITRNVRLSEAPSFGQPVMIYDPLSTGAKNYLDLSKEVISRNPRITAK
jgi:chromosome partitioning protein